MKKSFVTKCITIRSDQESFLIEEDNFKLSKFVQSKLDEYINAVKENRGINNDQTKI